MNSHGCHLKWIGEKGSVDEIGVNADDESSVLVRVDPRYFRPTEVDILIGDPAKAKKQLDWTPTTLFEDLVKEMTLADIPGLVEGAHKGVGLGDKFLRHIERCKILLHLIDVSENNLAENYLKIRSELKSYDPSISKKKEIIYLNKSDLVGKKNLKEKLLLFSSKIKKKYKIISVFKKDDIQTIKKVLITNVNR